MKRIPKRILSICDQFLSVILIVLMVVLVASVTWQVASRYLLRDPSPWTEEIARFALIWIGMLGAAYAYRTRAHLGLDLLANKLTGSARDVLELTVAVTIIFFAVSVMIVGGTKLALLTLELGQLSAVLGIRMAVIYLAIPVSGILITFFAISNVVIAIVDMRKRRGGVRV